MTKQDDETKQTVMATGELSLTHLRKAISSARKLVDHFRRQNPNHSEGRQLAIVGTHLEDAELHIIAATVGGVEKL